MGMTPSKFLFGAEGFRVLYEYSVGLVTNRSLADALPKGDRHPVLVIPGLFTTDSATSYLRNLLSEIGYTPYPWDLGRNLGPKDGIGDFLDTLVSRVEHIYYQQGHREISIIGWSLGGIYAREVSKVCPDKVRQVITLGTPFNRSACDTNATLLYELLNRDNSHNDPEIIRQIGTAPPVPFTSIYSKTDGVVHWECAIQEPGEQIENIEVAGSSHLGLSYNREVIELIANRLTQNKDTWSQYQR